jgi:hypothetical protein
MIDIEQIDLLEKIGAMFSKQDVIGIGFHEFRNTGNRVIPKTRFRIAGYRRFVTD